LFLRILVSGTFWTSKESNIFAMSIFKEMKIVKRKSQQEETRGREEGAPQGPHPWLHGGPRLPLMGPSLNFFALKSS
jgi:hypothetical protein